jgi:hypothetical protein
MNRIWNHNRTWEDQLYSKFLKYIPVLKFNKIVVRTFLHYTASGSWSGIRILNTNADPQIESGFNPDTDPDPQPWSTVRNCATSTQKWLWKISHLQCCGCSVFHLGSELTVLLAEYFASELRQLQSVGVLSASGHSIVDSGRKIAASLILLRLPLVVRFLQLFCKVNEINI